jgi:hypothetical protein
LVNFASNAVHFTVEVLDGRRVGIAKFVIQKPGEKTSPIEYQVDVDFEPKQFASKAAHWLDILCKCLTMYKHKKKIPLT